MHNLDDQPVDSHKAYKKNIFLAVGSLLLEEPWKDVRSLVFLRLGRSDSKEPHTLVNPRSYACFLQELEQEQQRSSNRWKGTVQP